MNVRPYLDTDQDAVVRLWKQVFNYTQPRHDPVASIRRKLAVERELLLVATDGDRVVGTVMGGYDGHRGWIYSLAVEPEYRRRGIARALVRHLERLLEELGCPKVNLQIFSENDGVVPFYESLGYTVEPRISMGKTLEAGRQPAQPA